MIFGNLVFIGDLTSIRSHCLKEKKAVHHGGALGKLFIAVFARHTLAHLGPRVVVSEAGGTTTTPGLWEDPKRVTSEKEAAESIRSN